MEVDLVYLWVDGSDPKWMAKKKACTGEFTDTEENCEGRYADHDELKYSLRSVEKYAPWIRRIFIVTDNQTPQWLDLSNPKIRIVDHSEILPEICRPCFNSSVIEHFIYRIPDLSEYFLYGNDDMLLNQKVTPEMFFDKDSLPVVRLNRKYFRRLYFFLKGRVLHPLKNHNKTVLTAARLVKRRYGVFYTGKIHHNIDAYRRSFLKETREMFDREISVTLTNHMRADSDIERCLYSYAFLAQKRARLQYVTQRTSFKFNIHDRKNYAKFERYNPVFFCMNDSQYATNEDRERTIEYLSRLFPDKSQFEK
ncbi:MAG: Stealth CR1 domain-containing protein [Porphyromonadaceae bacterium]|nr:Stealth CR1 domain-containing protein [Porphyromonadaceae bacterium]